MTREEIKSLGIEDLIIRDPHQEVKYGFIQGKVFHYEKGYLLPTDEPIYVTRAADPFAPQLAHFYNEFLRGENPSEIVLGHIETSNERVMSFKKWHAENPDRVGKMYPDKGCECIVEMPFMLGSPDDPEQNDEWFPYNYRLYHRDLHFYIPDDEIVMVYRGKDMALLTVMQKHSEFIRENPGYYSHPEMMLDYVERQIAAVLKFQTEKPERCGVTCAVFQKADSAKYSDAVAKLEEEKEAGLQENNLDKEKILGS